MIKDCAMTSSATQAIWNEVARQLALPELEEAARKTGEQAKIILGMLNDYVNVSAEMSEDQVVGVANLIFDRWSSRPHAPTAEELMMVATYINSCRS